MMHVPAGPDGERRREWMTAGVLCVHGAEQGETLYGTTQHSPPLTFFSFTPFFFYFLPTDKSKPKTGVLSGAVTLSSLPCAYVDTE